jgi:hypothetical protein
MAATMAKRRQLAYVVLKADWWNESAIRLIDGAAPATAKTVRLRAPFIAHDFQGVWLAEVPGRARLPQTPEQPVMLDLFVPWAAIAAMGIFVVTGGVKLGFAVESA